MKKILILITTLLSASLYANELKTVNYVDVSSYMGRWYEIARYENSFQRKCSQTRAFYAINKNKVSVLNECKTSKNKISKAKGTAFIVDTQSNAKLKVSFVPLVQRWGWFGGAYWIIELGENYEYAVIGHPTREYLWILSRTPSMEKYLLDDLKDRIQKIHHYDLTKLKSTPTWVD